MINWIEDETGDHCHVNHCDFDPTIDLALVMVVYFGGEEGYSSEIYPIEDFFETHSPERMHS